MAELSTNGIKLTPENVLATGRNSNGQVVFLESGNTKAGLQHIIDAHADNFANIGVQQSKIPDVVMQAATQGKLAGIKVRAQVVLSTKLQ